MSVTVVGAGPLGLLEPWARRRGLGLERRTVGQACGSPADLVVLLDAEEREVGWLEVLAAAGPPILAVGRGALALARALGGTVHRSFAVERDWITTCWQPGPVAPGPWLAWSDAIVDLPAGARCCGANGFGPQAFAAGRHVGVRFHPQVTPAIADAWIDRARLGEREAAGLRAAARVHAPEAARNAATLFDAMLPAAASASRPRSSAPTPIAGRAG